MANCSICGKSCGLMGGGKEPYTGNNLLVCNDCGAFFKQLDQSIKTTDKEKFDTYKAELNQTIQKTTPANRTIIEEYIKKSEEKFVLKEEEAVRIQNSSGKSEEKNRICPICKQTISAYEYTCSSCGYSLEEFYFTPAQKHAIQKDKEKQLLKNPFYEYKVEIVADSEILGKTSKTLLEDTIMRYALNGWRLHSVTVSEVGKNAVLGINSTVNNTILVFERCIKPEEK